MLHYSERTDLGPPFRYENQIAAIRCSKGWIHKLDVFKDAIVREKHSQGQWHDVEVNAQGCGIGVVLTELCLIDREIHTVDGQNRAQNLLTTAGTTLHENCMQLVGLQMTADPPSGGYVYFSAGMRRGFTRLLIDTCGGIRDEHAYSIPESYNRFHAYQTDVARQNFDSTTGDIEECAGYGRCNAYRGNWYFCDGHFYF